MKADDKAALPPPPPPSNGSAGVDVALTVAPPGAGDDEVDFGKITLAEAYELLDSSKHGLTPPGSTKDAVPIATGPKPAPVDPDAALSSILLTQHEGDAGKLLDGVFEFLHRRTNFFRQGNARERAVGAYERAAALSSAAPAGDLTADEAAAAAAGAGGVVAAATAAAATAAAAAASAAAAEVAATVGKEEEEEVAKGTTTREEEEQDKPPPPPPTKDAAADDDAKAAAAAAADAPSTGATTAAAALLKPNAGRGADLPTHSWTQTLAEVAVVVPLPHPPAPQKAWRARDLDVSIGKAALRVGVRGRAPILDAPLAESIRPDDCLWNLVDGRCVELTLTKAEGMHWWRRVLATDAEIDAAAVEPESSRLGDLDGETRATVEKMMFDQRQKALGLPTSDEMRREEVLRQFMAAHPEMDFTGAKIM